MGRKKISKNVFVGNIQKWSCKGMLLGTISPIRAAELVNSEEYEIINESAIDEVCF